MPYVCICILPLQQKHLRSLKGRFILVYVPEVSVQGHLAFDVLAKHDGGWLYHSFNGRQEVGEEGIRGKNPPFKGTLNDLLLQLGSTSCAPSSCDRIDSQHPCDPITSWGLSYQHTCLWESTLYPNHDKNVTTSFIGGANVLLSCLTLVGLYFQILTYADTLLWRALRVSKKGAPGLWTPILGGSFCVVGSGQSGHLVLPIDWLLLWLPHWVLQWVVSSAVCLLQV